MPFEKKKKHKTIHDYESKSVYLDLDNEYQLEVSKALKLCGHKQSKFLGLVVHDYFTRIGLNIDNVTKEQFDKILKLVEYCVKENIDTQALSRLNVEDMNISLSESKIIFELLKTQPPMNPMAMSPFIMPMQVPVQNVIPVQAPVAEEETETVVDDLSEMNEALAAFGV